MLLIPLQLGYICKWIRKVILLLNICICDDNPLQRKLLICLIHEYEDVNEVRFNLYEFNSGEDLLKKFSEDKFLFDLYFLDNHMKRLTGIETALRLRNYNRECNIVFVTASDEKYAFKQALPLKVLYKPAQQEDINKILNMVLAEKISKKVIDKV